MKGEIGRNATESTEMIQLGKDRMLKVAGFHCTDILFLLSPSSHFSGEHFPISHSSLFLPEKSFSSEIPSPVVAPPLFPS